MAEATKTPPAPWWMDAIKTLGLPTAFLMVLLYMIWSAGTWTGTNVVMPLFQKQTEFIQSAAEMTTKVSANVEIINKTLHAHSEHSVETLRIASETKDLVIQNGNAVRNIADTNNEVVGVLKKIEANTKAKEHQ